MIFVHELGHYLMAQFVGIRVEVFSLGFGPRLFGFQRGETDYRISLLPLGGYVKMRGENYDEKLSGTPDEFLSRPKLQRFLVALAGPAMNIGLAIGLSVVNFIHGIQVPAYLRDPAIIGKVAVKSPAADADLQFNDKILAIDGDPSPTWQDVEITVATSPERTLTLSVERNGQVFYRQVATSVAGRAQLGTIGVLPFIPCLIQSVEPASPATTAGLQPGDEILQVQIRDRSALGLYQILELIASHPDQNLVFQIKRDGQIFEHQITPVEIEDQVRIGVVLEGMPMLKEQYRLFEAIPKAFERNYRLTALTLDIVARIFTGRASLKTMSGPIEIARFSGAAAAGGLIQLLGFMALVSLQLGIFNLLPVPILDGGVIALLALEGIIRHDLSMQVKERISQGGFIFLLLLMGIVIFNDLSKNIGFLH